MDPLHTITLRVLSLKRVLLALTLAARVQTIHLLMLRNIVLGVDSVDIWLGGNIKLCRPLFNVQTVGFTAYGTEIGDCVCLRL